MTTTPPNDLVQYLEQHNQQHLLAWWDELDATAREQLAAQIAAVDFAELDQLLSDQAEVAADDTPEARARRAAPPTDAIRLTDTPQAETARQEAANQGEKLLAAGKVGILLVAGGQGSRLGFDQPKGMFPIGPVSNNMLFQLLIEQGVARGRRADSIIPYYVMTSDATHDETIDVFEKHEYFGLNRDAVHFFRQGNMPAVDAATGRLLLAEKGKLALGPDGHGGMLAALQQANLLEDMRSRGIEYLFYHQVDNPLTVVCDPVFLGFHASQNSEMSTKVVAKCAAEERMGVVGEVDGKTQIIEYSDMPDDVAALTDDAGQLVHWAGNTAIHVFNREFLERLTQDALAIPFHRAFKQVESIDETGTPQEPAEPNAYKFERFIFDALSQAKKALVFEADRASEFSPVKNAEGVDSPETAQRDMVTLHRSWLRQAGAKLPDEATVEISPLFALDAKQLCGQVTPGTGYGDSVHLSESAATDND